MADYDGRLFVTEADLVGVSPVRATSFVWSIDASEFAAVSGGPYVTPLKMSPLDMPTVVPELLLHNWGDGCSVESSYLVDVVAAITDAEERRLLSHRPTRSVVVRWTGLTRSRTYKGMMSLLRHGSSRMPVPLYSDYSTVASGGAAVKTIYCETAYRRFFAGQRCVVFDLVNGEPGNIEYAIIDNVQIGYLVLITNLSNTYSQGAIVFPLMDAEVSLKDSGTFITDTLGNILFRALEVAGASATLPTASGTPDGFQEYNGDPIFAPTPYLPNSGYVMGFARTGKAAKVGRGKITDTYGSRPKFTHKLRYRKFSREDVWDVIQFFDSRRGRFRRFWFVPPENFWNFTAAISTSVSIEAVGNIEDISDFFEHVAVIMDDGTIHIRTIDNVLDNSSTWRIDFDAEIAGLVFADVARVMPAQLVRFSKDAMRERWHTDQTCDIALNMIEVLDEDSVTLLCLT